ncbi:MAG: aminopeptidase P family N-terminal domain-containing protein, partial [Leptolyngbyaceae cyanobacterium]
MTLTSLSPVLSSVQTRLDALRSLMSQHQLDAYLVPSADEHLNEYLPEAKQRRQWISSFTGSAGDLLVAQNQAWLFADPRYYEQADLELKQTPIQVSKVGLEDHQTLEEIIENLGRDALKQSSVLRLGFDPFTLPVYQHQTWQKRFAAFGIILIPVMENLVDRVRVAQAQTNFLADYDTSPVFSLPDRQTGESVADKLKRIRASLTTANVDLLPVTKLDQIAWLYNLRGWDIPYNPVFIAYGLITRNQAFLFTNLERVSPEIQATLQDQVTLLSYDRYAATLQSLVVQTPGSRVLIDPHHTTMGTYQILTEAESSCQIQEGDHPVQTLKACKNATELAQMQQANLKASRAKLRTLKWVDDQLAAGKQLTEADVAAAIAGFYAQEPDFQGLSFNTIAATGANSSIVHYGTPSADTLLKPGELLLIDSGAQFAAGTTDDTRSIAIGTPTQEQIDRYTEVLKAHINCAMQRFPKGTTGAQLDGITRSTLWQASLDYGHGTGHGVGAFLNVHEGPNGISKRVNTTLEPGMITSVEPGFY